MLTLIINIHIMTESVGIVNIPIHQDGETPTVDARDLHQKLNPKTEYRKWITYRIKTYGFAPNVDFWEKICQNHNCEIFTI